MDQVKRVIARRYGTRAEAEMAAMELNAVGIDTHIVSDDVGGTYPSMAHANGVAVLVPEDQLAPARELLDGMNAPAATDTPPAAPPVGADPPRTPPGRLGWLPIPAAFVFGAALASLVWWRAGKSYETGTFPFTNAEGRIVAWHEFVNGEMVKVTEDRDLDGRRDAWHSYRNGRPTKTALDNNFDCKEDYWSEWDNASGQIIRVDQNFDGTWDAETRCDMQIPLESRMNLDFEGRPDAVIRYKNGIADSMDVIPGGGSTFLFRVKYIDGVLKEVLADDNMDGVFDRKEVYDSMGRRLSDTPLSPHKAAKP